jgi:hypothetical protein
MLSTLARPLLSKENSSSAAEETAKRIFANLKIKQDEEAVKVAETPRAVIIDTSTPPTEEEFSDIDSDLASPTTEKDISEDEEEKFIQDELVDTQEEISEIDSAISLVKIEEVVTENPEKKKLLKTKT